MLTSMSRIIGCFTVSVSTLFAIACSYQEMGFFFLDWINNFHLPNSDTLFFGWMGWDGITFLSGWGGYIIESGI